MGPGARPSCSCPPPPADPPPAPAAQAPERPPLPASTIRPSVAGRAKPADGRRYRVIGAVAVVAVIILAGSLALVFRQPPASTKPGVTAMGRAAATRSSAAAWIASQVSPAALIACDPAMCRALSADGFPPYDTRPLSPGGSPLSSTLVVATAAVRAELGSRLAAVDAPGVIASFGAGASRVDVRLVAQNGPAAFRSALSADLALRRQSGADFLESSRVGVSSQALGPIEAGQVDTRLLIMLTNLEFERAIQIVSFSDAAPGASLDVSPFRSAVIEQIPEGAQLPAHQFATKMLSYLRTGGLPQQFKVASSGPVQLPDGQTGVRIEFAAPEPLGLLSGTSLSRPAWLAGRPR